ncbi:MAG: glycosyltransferase family 39 protein [Planctomycetes bacterium]|nr:glycosyltransferase family 39 protein [Planctomycetota bacterium]
MFTMTGESGPTLAETAVSADGTAQISWWEFLLLPGLMVLQLVILQDPIPLTHLFWLDEIHTQLLVDDPDLPHAATALSQGVDFNPPTYFLLARLVTSSGIPREVSQRAASFGCVVACCVCVYLMARDRGTRTAATASALLIWSFDVVQSRAFESRFYALWMGATGLTALCLHRATGSPAFRWRIGLLIGSVVMCTVHYFGVIALGLIAATYLLQTLINRRGDLRALFWMTPGLILLFTCIVVFYRGQRSALSVATWVPAVDWKTNWQFIRELVPMASMSVLTMAWLILPRRKPAVGQAAHGGEAAAKSGGTPSAIGLLLMPFCLIAFSLTVQPALISRYGAVGIIGFAIVTGVMLRRLPNWCSVAFGIWFFASGLQTLQFQIDRWHRIEARHSAIIARLRQIDGRPLLLFESRHDMYPIVHYAPDLAPRICYLALSDENLRDFHSASPFRIVERDVAQRIEQFYPKYRSFPFDELQTVPRSVLVAFRNRKDFGKQLEGFSVTQLQPQIFEVVPTPLKNLAQPVQVSDSRAILREESR